MRPRGGSDTAYDASGVYEAIENHSAHRSPRVLIPPRKDAQLASGPASSRQRNRNIAAQARLGKRKWHTESGYSKRSKVETTFHRYKAIVGSAMRARGLAAQRVEARIGCKILNTMTAVPSIYSSARPELDWSSVYRHHTYMISSFVLALISAFKARRELVPADE